MDIESLRDLANHGFAAVPADALGELGQWCWDYGEASGDARYTSIGRALLEVFEWWTEHDERGGIPMQLAKELESIITSSLPAIVSASSPSDAAPLARLLRQELEAQLTGPRDWMAKGYVSRK